MGKKQKKHSTKPADSKDIKKIHPGYRDSFQMKLFTPEVILIGVFMLALVLRLLYLKQMTATPLFHGLVVDAEKFDGLALKILGGDFTHKEFIYLSPLYPFFLSLIYSTGGYNQFSVVCTQAVLDSLSCILLYYSASTLFNKAVGLIAAITYACYGLAIFYTGTILAPTLVIFLSLAFIASLLRGETRKPSTFFISGVLFGLVVAARPNIILFLFLLPLWFFTVLKSTLGISRSVRRLSLFLVGFLAVMSLVTLRNYSIGKSFSPFSVQGGINFYIGNNPKATGTFMSPHGLSSSPIEQVKTSIRYAEKQLGKPLTPFQASRYWLSRGLTYIKNNPLDAFSLFITKGAFFLRKEELPLNVDYSLSRDFLPIFRLPFITFGIVAPFALLGIILSLKRKKGILLVLLFMASLALSVTIFFVTARYRMPIVPFLIIYSSYALYALGGLFRAKAIKEATVYGTVLIVFLIGINYDFTFFTRPFPAKHFSNLGMLYSRQGKTDEALAVLKRALSIDPDCSEAHFNLGNVYREKGSFNEAIDCYKKTLEINPDFAEAHNNLGMTYGKQGLLDEAIAEFNRALTINPTLVDAHYNRGTAYARKGELQKALSDFKAELVIHPDNANAHFNLGMVYLKQGMRDEAITQFKRAIAIDPDLEEPYKKIGLHKDVIVIQ
jgi:tetratricopeptide (TPR) repeat protein